MSNFGIRQLEKFTLEISDEPNFTIRLRISVEMVDLKTVVVFVVTVLSVFLQPGIRAQPTIGSSAEDDFCSQLEDEVGFQVEENACLRSLLESERMTLKTLENVSNSHAEEIQGLRLELEDKQQKIETLANVSSSRAEENHELNMELEIKQHQTETLENVSSARAEEINRVNLELGNKQQMIATLGNESTIKAEEIHRLNLELEKKQQKIETLENEGRGVLKRESKSATATFIGSFDHSQSPYGITQVEDKIYVLDHNPNRIKVYEDMIGFRFMRNIALSGTSFPNDIVYSNKSKCVFISDRDEKCIWVMTTTSEYRLTKWMTNVTWPNTLSLTREGHLFVLRYIPSFSQDSLEIYSLNATLIRRLYLPQDIEEPRHVVQISTGNFIIGHQVKNASSRLYAISQLTNDGHLIHRFISRNQSKTLSYTEHLSLDSDNNRLFVTDSINNRVILFDSRVLTWSQVLLSQQTNGICKPFRLFYDARKKYLFVAQHQANVTVYEINKTIRFCNDSLK